MVVPAEVLAKFRIVTTDDLGGHANHHWAVRQGARKAILRRAPADTLRSLNYELKVLEALHSHGWPVARAVDEPAEVGQAIWCLFEHLPGSPASDRSVPAQRARGRLLATLHDDLAELVAFGQRPGWFEVRRVVEDPNLVRELRGFEDHFPEAGRILRWHAERAKELFDAIGPGAAAAPKLVLPGDFAPWNLLYVGDRLSGILDFEAAHLDTRRRRVCSLLAGQIRRCDRRLRADPAVDRTRAKAADPDLLGLAAPRSGRRPARHQRGEHGPRHT
ncbi:MAG: hypothetical protein WAM30_19605 [Candidatus Dormiibacterota bacterium]